MISRRFDLHSHFLVSKCPWALRWFIILVVARQSGLLCWCGQIWRASFGRLCHLLAIDCQILSVTYCEVSSGSEKTALLKRESSVRFKLVEHLLSLEHSGVWRITFCLLLLRGLKRGNLVIYGRIWEADLVRRKLLSRIVVFTSITAFFGVLRWPSWQIFWTWRWQGFYWSTNCTTVALWIELRATLSGSFASFCLHVFLKYPDAASRWISLQHFCLIDVHVDSWNVACVLLLCIDFFSHLREQIHQLLLWFFHIEIVVVVELQ